MSSLQKRIEADTDTRLTAIADTAANLKTQLGELNRLRDRVRKVAYLARRSRGISALVVIDRAVSA
jgi:hypothetical protein